MKSTALWLRFWLLALSVLLTAVLLAGLGGQAAYAASTNRPGHSAALQPLAGCAPCIVAPVTPAPGTSVTPDAQGKVTIIAAAQLNNNYTAFTLSIDKVDVPQNQIQITATDPTQPTLQYSGQLSVGSHHAFVQVSDASASTPVTSYGWDFTVLAAPTPTAKPTTTTGSGGSGGSGGSSSGIFAPKTLSIILFSIAGLGLLVIIFIAGMWYSGSRELRRNP